MRKEEREEEWGEGGGEGGGEGKNKKEKVGEEKRNEQHLRDGFEPPLVESESTVIATTLTEEGMCRKPSVTILICNKRMKS